MIGDTHTAALVGKDGSIDWMCVPRFDSGACFASLLGEARHGRWLIAPRGSVKQVRRRYRPGTLILETELTTAEGTVRLTDWMPRREGVLNLIRMVEGVSGVVPMRMELVIRFDYGSVIPWVRKMPNGCLSAVAGPDALQLTTPIETRGEGMSTVAQFLIHPGQRVPFSLAWYPSYRPGPVPIDPLASLEETERYGQEWAGHCTYQGPWKEAVISSLVTLKALTFAPTGGIVAAPTTSLPELVGGTRNWDYRYCWLRDATLTLYAMMSAGYHREAGAWRDWLLRSVAGEPAKLQIMYGVTGERRIEETEAAWLPGYEGSSPVRIGNAAVHQLQLDVYGEVMDLLHQSRKLLQGNEPAAWDLQVALLEFLESGWREKDKGLWETRGPAQHFVHSKVMAWVAFDRAVKSVEQFQGKGPVERWRALRDDIHREICTRGWNARKQAFTESYDSDSLDASLLLLPQVGFLPAKDPRVLGTVAAIERELIKDGFVRRYQTSGQDGLPPGEGAFLACTFWLADSYALIGRRPEAKALYERLLSLRNDVGLLSEEYDTGSRRLMGNFPQAFSHVGVINTAFNLGDARVAPMFERHRA